MSKQTSKGNLLDTSIMNGFEIITQLGGYIILFSILSGLLMDLHPFGSASPLLCGVLEITTGIAQLAASSLPYAGKSLLSLPAPPSAVSLSLPRQTV